ncbi:MAG: sulfite exporter TauE/SafE family protein [Candidatus Acetothermia bacterium]|nr:sulfite exporter TauE/SafE family protein [Candidatus Acetothermia bacterium]
MVYLLLALAGCGVGGVASMLGIGGGLFMVPLLLLAGLVPTSQEAVGTSIAAVMVTGLSSTAAYRRKQVTNWKVGLAIIPGAMAGGWLGAYASQWLASGWLAMAFGLFLLYPAGVLLLGRQPKDLFSGRGRTAVGAVAVLAVGLLAGTASGLFGIGGGVIMVPALTLLGLDIVPAVATSLFVMIPSAALATVQHALAGHTHWDLALPLVAGIVVGTQFGPALSTRMPAVWLRRLFALLLLYTAANMIRQGLG